MFNPKFCQLLDLNRGSLVSEATALPSEPQPLPNLYLQIYTINLNNKSKLLLLGLVTNSCITIFRERVLDYWPLYLVQDHLFWLQMPESFQLAAPQGYWFENYGVLPSNKECQIAGLVILCLLWDMCYP